MQNDLQALVYNVLQVNMLAWECVGNKGKVKERSRKVLLRKSRRGGSGRRRKGGTHTVFSGCTPDTNHT